MSCYAAAMSRSITNDALEARGVQTAPGLAVTSGQRERCVNEVVEVYRHLFAARTDVYSRWTDQGWRPTRAEMTNDIVAAGLSKQGPAISGFMIAPGDVSHIAAIDFDLDNGMALAQRLVAHMASVGAPAYLEGSRRGAHVWILLEDVSPARQIRAALQTWLTKAGMPMDPEHPHRIHPKIELRPATDRIPGDDGLGHALRMPLMPHPKTGQRYRITTADGKLMGPKLGDIILAMDYVPSSVLAEAAMRWEPIIDPSQIPSWSRNVRAPREDDDASAAELLRTLWGALDAAPGKVVSCPAKQYHSHGDVHKGCKIFPDDKRVMCHKPGCVLNGDGKGLGTWQLAHFAPANGG